MSATPKWEAQLAGGTPMDLHQLARSNDNSGHFWIWGGVNDYLDCRDDNFSFSSSHFDGIDDDVDLAWQVAHELLSLFNGAMSLMWHQEHPFRLGALLHNGRNTSHVEKRNAKGLLGPLSPFAKRGRDRADSSYVFRVLTLACENQDAYHLVKLFEQSGGWSSYYKILETIESYTTKYKLEVSVDKGIQKSFERTANNFSISGFDSRHGFKQQVKEIKSAALTLDDGFKFIRDYAIRYLSARYGHSLKEIPATR